jgi:hypothetical protein
LVLLQVPTSVGWFFTFMKDHWFWFWKSDPVPIQFLLIGTGTDNSKLRNWVCAQHWSKVGSLLQVLIPGVASYTKPKLVSTQFSWFGSSYYNVCCYLILQLTPFSNDFGSKSCWVTFQQDFEPGWIGNTSVRFAFLLIMSCNTIALCMVTHDICCINWLVAIWHQHLHRIIIRAPNRKLIMPFTPFNSSKHLNLGVTKLVSLR